MLRARVRAFRNIFIFIHSIVYCHYYVSCTIVSHPFCRNLEYSQDENYLTINYKKIKKKNIASVDLYFPFILFYLWILCESAAAKIEKCDAATQQSIFQNLPQCEPRTSLVDLRQFFVDNQDIIQVIYKHKCLCNPICKLLK